MYARQTQSFGGGLGGFGGSGPPPKDVIVLLVVVFLTFSLRFFDSTSLLPALLELRPSVYQLGFVWQLATYPFVGVGAPGIWFLLELLILFWFSRDMFRALGRRRFWTVIVGSAVGAAVVATAVVMVNDLVLGAASPNTFVLMQGQRMLTVITLTAFSVLFRHATILLFFILPVQARWFLWLSPLFGFMGFLASRDLAGFVGICVAVALTYVSLTTGGFLRFFRQTRLRFAGAVKEAQLRRLRRKRDFKIVKGEEPRQGPWVH